MFKLVIQDDEGKTTIVPLIRDEITIGRKEGNTIRLTERNVSRRHARILRNNGEVHIEDLGSYNGIRVNNARIAERVSLRVSDQVQIGDYKLYLKAEGLEQADESRTMPLERVDSQVPTDTMPAVTPIAGSPPMAIPSTPPQLVGSPNRTMVAIADTDPTGRSIGPATAAAVAAMTATTGYGRLVVVSSNFAGKEFELSRPQMIIGRTDENDIVVNHRSISRNHAKLVRDTETNRYTISDLQSSNGVRVNGQDYGKVELRRGDVVDLGHVRLRFVEAGEDFVFARDAVITDVPEAGSRRGLLVALLAVIVVLVGGGVLYMMREKPADSGSEVAPGPGPGSASGAFMPDGGDTVAIIEQQDPPPEPATQPQPGVTVDNAPKSDDVKAQIGACKELVTQKKWQALEDCARELDKLGAGENGKEFHEKALHETQNDARLGAVTQALKEGNLKAAQATLREIGDDSVYSKSARDAFTKVERGAIESARRAATAFASKNDCNGLKRFVQQQREASIESVAQAAANVRCAPPNVAAAGDPTVKQNPPPANPANPPPANPANPPPAVKSGCDAAVVEETLAQAANQYSSGYAKSGLTLILKVIGCRQDVRMYRLAGMYACGARDLANAKLFFNKVPQAQQAPIEQRCQQEGLNIRAP